MNSNTSASSTRRVTVLLLLFLIGIGILLRVSLIDIMLTDDEAISAITPFTKAITTYLGHTNHLLHEVLTRGVILLLGRNYVTIRLVSLTTSILALFAMFEWGRRMHNRLSGILGVSFMSVSAPLILYAVRSEGYSLYIFFTTLALLLATNCIRRTQHHWASWLWLGAVFALGLYTIPIMLYPMGVCLSWILLTGLFYQRDELADLLTKLCVTLGTTLVITLIFYTPVFYKQGLSFILGNQFIQPMGYTDWAWKFIRVFQQNTASWTGGYSLSLIGLWGVGVGLSWGLDRDGHTRMLIVSSLFFPMIFSLFYPVVMPPRGWLFMLPILYVVTAVGLSRAIEIWWQTDREKMLMSSAIVLILISLLGHLTSLRRLQQKPTMAQARTIISTLNHDAVRSAKINNPFYDNLLIYLLKNPAIDRNRLVDQFKAHSRYLITTEPERPFRHVRAHYRWPRNFITSKKQLVKNEVGKVIYVETGKRTENHTIGF